MGYSHQEYSSLMFRLLSAGHHFVKCCPSSVMLGIIWVTMTVLKGIRDYTKQQLGKRGATDQSEVSHMQGMHLNPVLFIWLMFKSLFHYHIY